MSPSLKSPPPVALRTGSTALVIALLATVGLLANGPAFAGVVFEVEVTHHEASPPKTHSIEILIDGQSLRMGLPADIGSAAAPEEIIFRGARPEMVFIDHNSRSKMTIEGETLDRINRHQDEALAHMEQALRKVPEAQRAAIEQTMRRNMQQVQGPERPRLKLVKTGEEAVRGGYFCVRYEVLRGSQRIRELWVTDWSNIEGGDEASITFERMASFFTLMAESISRYGQGKAPMESLAFEKLDELGGFPLVVREFDAGSGELQVELALRSVKNKALAAEAFKDPIDYRQREIFAARR